MSENNNVSPELREIFRKAKRPSKESKPSKPAPKQRRPEEDSLDSLGSFHFQDEWPERPGKAAYHGLAGEVVDAIAPPTEADRVALLVQFLVAFGNAIGRNRYRVIGGRRHHSNLFAVMVGKTGKGRKGTSWAEIERLMEEAAVDPAWTGERILNGLSSGEGIIFALRDQVMGKDAEGKSVVKDHGVSDKRLLIVEEEFASVLRVGGRECSTLSTTIRQLWDGKRLGNLTKNSPFRATDPHGSILGHVTKPDLLEHLSRNDRANGYANRFLWVCVRRSKLLPDGGGRPDCDALKDRLRDAVRFGQVQGEMKRDALARDLWHRVYPKLSRDRPGVLGQVTSRAEAQVSRLAMVYALLDRSDTICESHLKAALSLWKYCERSCAWIFGDSTGNRDADALLAELRQIGGMTHTEIAKFFGNNKSVAQLKIILGPLVEQRLVIPGKPATGGKPAVPWRPAGKTS